LPPANKEQNAWSSILTTPPSSVYLTSRRWDIIFATDQLHVRCCNSLPYGRHRSQNSQC